MRKVDKLKQIERANILSEQRHIKENSLVREDSGEDIKPGDEVHVKSDDSINNILHAPVNASHYATVVSIEPRREEESFRRILVQFSNGQKFNMTTNEILPYSDKSFPYFGKLRKVYDRMGNLLGNREDNTGDDEGITVGSPEYQRDYGSPEDDGPIR